MIPANREKLIEKVNKIIEAYKWKTAKYAFDNKILDVGQSSLDLSTIIVDALEIDESILQCEIDENFNPLWKNGYYHILADLKDKLPNIIKIKE